MARTQRFDSVRHDWKPKGSSTKNKLMVAGLFVFTVGTYVFTMARIKQTAPPSLEGQQPLPPSDIVWDEDPVAAAQEPPNPDRS
mmetsp:Transcript_11191/g.20211  ORF Transcript_11191/g.20211 Transcript_11191/m.20211 type:complete len:84 (-) Transcript_11191:900-1151(-)